MLPTSNSVQIFLRDDANLPASHWQRRSHSPDPASSSDGHPSLIQKVVFFFFSQTSPSLSISWVVHLKLLWHSDANITIDTRPMGLECKWTGFSLSLPSCLLSDLILLSKPNEGKLIACALWSGRRGYGHVEIGVWGDRGNATRSLQEINFSSSVSLLWNTGLMSVRSRWYGCSETH